MQKPIKIPLGVPYNLKLLALQVHCSDSSTESGVAPEGDVPLHHDVGDISFNIGQQDSYYLPTSSDSESNDDGEAVTLDDIVHAYIPHTSPSGTSESNEDAFSDFLYTGAQITVGLSVILILSFVINHNLTDAALRDLLHIISLHCPSQNLCVTSLYMFKKYFEATKFNFQAALLLSFL